MNKNKSTKRSSRRSTKKVSPSKNLKLAVKQVLKKEVETKTINVPDATSGTTNTVSLIYPSGSGLQYLCQDVFKVRQGVNDTTVLNAFNRIGDRVRGVGFLMDYYFHIYNSYPIGGVATVIPWVKLRITLWKQAFGSPLLTAPLLYDTNFLNVNTSTLQPIDWDEGYVKDIIYDKVHVIRAESQNVVSAVYAPFPYSNVFHFKKYFKYDKIIKYMDNNTTSPTSTDMPIYITISAEVDDSNSFVPSGSRILSTTGYTRAWFKDA